ncbi:hypothetical protein Ngar_c09080 [Candidatus Nitrososphaera gargensis Ga9.2]|uniref:Uncharacterized protein n=1 Tax=Nitrososphaera gargensis (strain Ga9.2) TaxID=1237085 RepID=K0IDQ7_NITGG|nr:hypothetical protein Ngar_c09080 [Candidatus Nitrososphaera gargensis Ga9.2]
MTDNLIIFLTLPLFFAITSSFGWLVLSRTRIKKNPKLIEFPIYSLVGFSSILLILWLGLLSNLPLNALSIAICVISALGISYWVKTLRRDHTKKEANHLEYPDAYITLKKLSKSYSHQIAIIALAIFIIVFFSWFLVKMSVWSPAGDATSHGTIISLILSNNGRPESYQPISNASFDLWRYPLGYHVITYFFAFTFNIIPAISMVSMAVFISMLIPLLIFSSILSVSGRIFLAVSASLLAFLAPQFTSEASPVHDLLYSNILNGTYPSHTANLLIIGLVGILCFLKDSEIRPNLRHIILIMVISIAAFLTYYIYLVFIIFICIIIGGVLFDTKKPIILLAVVFVGLLIGQGWFTFSSDIISQTINDFKLRMKTYTVTKDDIDTIYLVIILAPFWLIFLKPDSLATGIILSMLTLFIPMLFNVFIPIDWQSLWMFPTRRIWPTLFGISIVASYVILANISKHYRVCALLRYTQYSLLAIGIAVMLIFAFYFNPGNWQVPTADDRRVMEWISNNVSRKDLVVNDMTFQGLFLTSVAAQNVTSEIAIVSQSFASDVPIDNEFAHRSLELTTIFLEPRNYQAHQALLQKYNASYIFVSSSQVYLDYWNPVLKGGILRPEYKYKTDLSQQDYLKLFDENPNLRLAFKSGESAVYKVIN